MHLSSAHDCHSGTVCHRRPHRTDAPHQIIIDFSRFNSIFSAMAALRVKHTPEWTNESICRSVISSRWPLTLCVQSTAHTTFKRSLCIYVVAQCEQSFVTNWIWSIRCSHSMWNERRRRIRSTVCVCVMCFVCGRTTANRGKRSTIQWRTCNEIAAVTTVMYIHNLFARHPQGRLLVISAVVMANGMPQEFMHRSSSSWSSFSAFRPTNWIF